MITTQIELDYVQAANQRVSSDTLVLTKKTTLNLAADASTLALPPELIRLEALYIGSKTVPEVSAVDYMRLVTGAVLNGSELAFATVGRTLYVYPTSAQAVELTVFYSYRPAPIDSGSTFELTGVAERLVERLVSAYVLMDDGQPELSQAELAAYMIDAGRVKRRDRRREGHGHSLLLAGRRRPPG